MENEALILGPYKEPLKAVEEGFGYEGALTFNTLGQVQCHVCGELFDDLASHIRNAHKISAKEYRTKYSLAVSTKLVSEKYREEKKNNHLRYLQTLSPEQRKEHRRKAMAAIARCNEVRREKIKSGEYKPGNDSLEQKNKRGICPDQLLDIVKRSQEHFGYTPSVREFEGLYGYRYHEPIRRTFGSFSNAVRKAGLQERPKKGHAPKGIPRIRHTDDELLDYLQVFYQEHGMIPTAGDCNRGLLPSYASYTGHFGSFPNARKLAGVPDLAPNANRQARSAPLQTSIRKD